MSENEPEVISEQSTELEPRFCRDCARLVGVRRSEENAENWKCAAAESKLGKDLITGNPLYKYRCREARENNLLCGIEGKWYEEYKAPVYDEEPRVSRKTIRSADELLDKLL